MKLEGLPNELLLDLFEFFDPIQLINTFQNLNTRFNNLLFVHFCSYRLDLRSTSKTNLCLICEEYLPLIIDNVSSLCLSDGEKTPCLSDHLLAYGLTIDEFTHLRSLLLQDIESSDTLLNITLDCLYLPYLTHLKIIKCYFTSNHNPKDLFLNIWSFTKLTHCTLDIVLEKEFSFASLSIISMSLKYLSIEHLTFSSSELSYLLKTVPNLRYLCIKFGQNLQTPLCQIPVASSITSLKIHFDGSQSALTHILKSLPNLSYLAFTTTTLTLDGNQWQQILIDYVPQIKRFRFLMKFLLVKNNSIITHIDDTLNTFRTPFWLKDHQWFVRCDWSQNSNKVFILYTVPYCFGDTHVIHQNQCSKATCPNDSIYYSYDRVLKAFYKKRINNFNLQPTTYPNIRHLTLQLPVDSHFWIVIPNLDHLISLEIIEIQESKNPEVQLTELLNRTPCLEFLTLDAISVLRLTQANINHSSIRRVHLKHYQAQRGQYMNAEQCFIFANSWLGRQCEVLTIHLTDRTIILDLIRIMCNLRALKFECQYDYFRHASRSYLQDELVDWLRHSLPEKYSINRHRIRYVNIWIDR